MALQVEYVDGALPYGLAVERLFDGLSANQHGPSAVLPFNRLLELVCGNVGHCVFAGPTGMSKLAVILRPTM